MTNKRLAFPLAVALLASVAQSGRHRPAQRGHRLNRLQSSPIIGPLPSTA